MAVGVGGFVTGLGNLESYAQYFGTPFFFYGWSLISLIIGYDYIEGKIDTVHMLYFGTVMALLIELCAAAYIVWATVQATVNAGDLLYASFKGYSILQNQIAYYEFGYFTLYIASALTLIVMAFFGATQMWELLELREEGAAEGFLGRAVAWDDAIKFMAMGTAVVVTSYYAAYSIGETVDQTITWVA